MKKWHIIIFVLAAVALGVTAYRSLANRGPQINHDSLLIDVETGALYTLSTRRGGILLPAASPETSRRTVLRVARDEDTGRLRVTSRDMELLRAIENIAAVDPATGEVLPRFADQQPKPYR